MTGAYILFLVRMGANLRHTLSQMPNETEEEKFVTVCLMDRAENSQRVKYTRVELNPLLQYPNWQ